MGVAMVGDRGEDHSEDCPLGVGVCYDPLAIKAVRYALLCTRTNVAPSLGN